LLKPPPPHREYHALRKRGVRVPRRPPLREKTMNRRNALRLETVGVTIPVQASGSPKYLDLARYIPSEIEKWARPIKASGVPAD